MRTHRFGGALVALLALGIVACSGDDDETGPSTTGTTNSWISDAKIGTTQGLYTGTTTPAATGGPAVTLSGNTIVVNGGTSQLAVIATEPFARLYVAVSGLSGYYDVPLPAPATSATLVLSYTAAPPGTTFSFSVAAVSASGAVGTPTTLAAAVRAVDAGELQITLSWDAPSDLDLHVVEPSGEEIYWNNRTSATGGTLNLDSNATCVIDNVRAENVVWVTAPPAGTYTVRVDMWANCATAATNYVLRVNNGATSTTYTGTLTGPGDEGGRGSGVTVATFTR